MTYTEKEKMNKRSGKDKRYRKSAKGKANQKRYRASEKGIAVRKARDRRYRESVKLKELQNPSIRVERDKWALIKKEEQEFRYKKFLQIKNQNSY